MPMRIGLLGGTFNPIHSCHLHIAEQTCERLRFDRLLFIPSSAPPHKSSDSLAPASHRFAMVQQAIAPYSQFHISDIEIRFPQTSYTYDTIHRLYQELDSDVDLFFLIGLDAFLEIASWKQAQALVQTCHFVVLSRPSHRFTELPALPLLPSMPLDALQALDQEEREQLVISTSQTSTITLLALPPCDASASTIRQHLKAGWPVSHWLPASVESYIIQHRLYDMPVR